MNKYLTFDKLTSVKIPVELPCEHARSAEVRSKMMKKKDSKDETYQMQTFSDESCRSTGERKRDCSLVICVLRCSCVQEKLFW